MAYVLGLQELGFGEAAFTRAVLSRRPRRRHCALLNYRFKVESQQILRNLSNVAEFPNTKLI
jgi:hypothetical protein